MGTIDWNPLHSPYFETVATTTQALTGIPVNSIATGIFGTPTAPEPTTTAYMPPLSAPYVPVDEPDPAPLGGVSTVTPMWVWIVLGLALLLVAFFLFRNR